MFLFLFVGLENQSGRVHLEYVHVQYTFSSESEYILLFIILYAETRVNKTVVPHHDMQQWINKCKL